MKAQLMALVSKKAVIAGIAAVIALAGGIGVMAETGTLSSLGGSPSPSASAQAATTDASDSALPEANAGGKNVVQVVNRTDGRFAVDGKVRLNRIPAPNAGPENLAIAYSQCSNCQTLAVALEINLISTQANNVQPKNAAAAVNVLCNGCVTIARAIQYNISVDDPTNVPPSVNRLLASMKAEVAHIKTQSTSITEAESRFDALIAQFQELAANLKDARQQETAANTPGATPMPSSAPTDSTPQATPSEPSSPEPSPTASP